MQEYETRKPKIHNEGIWGTHDMACAVCHDKPALMNCQTEVFSPCWNCQKKGYGLFRIGKFWRKFFKEESVG